MSWFEIGGSSSVYLVESESGKRTLTTADKGCFNGRTLTRRSKQRCFGNTDTEKYWVQTENLFGCGAFYTIKKKKEKKKYFITFEPLWEIKHNHHTPTHIWNVSTEAKVQFDHKKKRHCSSERQAACCVHAKSACNIKAKFKTWQAEAGKHRNIHSTRYQK